MNPEIKHVKNVRYTYGQASRGFFFFFNRNMFHDKTKSGRLQ